MAETERVEGKVARILNDREVVINRGASHKVAVGTRFAILLAGPEIIDPDTGQAIGPIDLPKSIVKVVRVESLYSVARTFRTKLIRGFQILAGTPDRTEIEELDIDDALVADIPADDWKIKVGDKAVETKGDEYLPDKLD